ncbi:MAG TPA: DUF3347 domain-containing protein [Ferruginibacter sp.]|jgi:hypothetical protein|nr:DUF3347 domain-containing protein [Ferruginibacter sp.]
MKKVVLTLILLVLLFGIYWMFLKKSAPDAPQSITQNAIKIGAHSASFNYSIDTLVNAYLELKNNFVDNDSVKAKVTAAKVATLSDSVKLDELKKDTSGIYATALSLVGNIKSNAQSVPTESTITAMRKDFQNVTENLFPLLKMIHYEGNTLYLQNCPMAFGEGNDANWISNSPQIINPYLGRKDPTMVHCGETKDSIVSK